MVFDDRDYTFDTIIKQLGLIELHCKDGSASEENCKCIDTKHLYLLEGLAEEGMGFALSGTEKQFYSQLGDLVRLIRKNMEREDWNLHGVMRDVMKKEHPIPIRYLEEPTGWSENHGPLHNPYPRKYLPSHLTTCELDYPSVQKKLASCIKKLEPKEKTGEIESAVAVCRASIPCPP